MIQGEEKLSELDTDLATVIRRYGERWPIIVLETHRSKARQEALLLLKKSKVKWSNHNYLPARAVDSAPLPLDWDMPWAEPHSGRWNRLSHTFIDAIHNYARWMRHIGRLEGLAHAAGVATRSGSDWDNDSDLGDESWRDLAHLEKAQ